MGSDESALVASIKSSLAVKSNIEFSALNVKFNEKSIPTVHYALNGDFSNCKICFALVSLSETTSIPRGENEGRTLINQNVVRQFLSEDAKAMGEIVFSTTPVPSKENMAVIAFVQRNDNLIILGAAEAVFPVEINK